MPLHKLPLHSALAISSLVLSAQMNAIVHDLAEQAAALASSEAVRTMFELGDEAQASANEVVRDTLKAELGLATSLVSATAWFGQALYLNQADKRFFPADWVEPTCRSNPDIIMACVLCQLANYGHSVIELVSRGLDTPARALLRATADLSYAVAALAADRETFQTFVLDTTSAPKEHWYKLFSNRKLAQRIARVDQTLGLPRQWTESMKAFREGNSEFFSEAVHHSRTSLLIGAQPTVPGTDRVAFALLGGPPSGSGLTLGHLVTVLNYALTTLIASPHERPEHEPSFTYPDCWQTGISIHGSVQSLFIVWLKERDG